MTGFDDSVGRRLLHATQDVGGLRSELRPGDALLVGVNPRVDGVRFLLDGSEHLVGSGPEADVWLEHITVGRRHARLLRTPEGWDVVDEHTVGGTWVNGRTCSRASLHDGDRIRFGALLFLMVTKVRTAQAAPRQMTAA